MSGNTPEVCISRDMTKILAKPVWDRSDDHITRTDLKNKIATSDIIEKLVVEAAHAGLNATTKVFFEGREVAEVPDYGTRHRYWRDILIMKRWLNKTDVNIDMRTLTINAQEEEILKRYAAE